jgi:hypothetical protein
MRRSFGGSFASLLPRRLESLRSPIPDSVAVRRRSVTGSLQVLPAQCDPPAERNRDARAIDGKRTLRRVSREAGEHFG